MQLEELVSQLKESGTVGAGGAGFPSYAKLDSRADTIILNCAECEPLFKVHRQLLERYAFEIVSALCMVAGAVGADTAIVAVKPSYAGAVDAVKSILPSFPKVRLSLLPEVYPAGDEVVLIYETTGRVVTPGSLPITVGTIVYNVETMLNAWRFLHDGKPVTHKYVMVGGAVASPTTLLAPIGTAFSELVRMAGGVTVKGAVLLNGGPMTGQIGALHDVVTKTTNAVLVLPRDHYVIQKRLAKTGNSIRRAMSACCSCRMCTDLCPRNLLGHPIDPKAFMNGLAQGKTDDVTPFVHTLYCSQCGLCELYACGQELSPRTLIGACKTGLQKNGVRPQPLQAKPVPKERAYRQIPVSRLVARLGLKRYDVEAPIDSRAVPVQTLTLPLKQHIGAPAQPLVAPGDRVTSNQKIADMPDGQLGAPIHAPADGTVEAVSGGSIRIKIGQSEE